VCLPFLSAGWHEASRKTLFLSHLSIGQPQQRPPSLTANPALASQYRPSYPYGMPPRNVLPAGAGYVSGIQPNTHRPTTQQSQVQSLTPQPGNAFNQQRGQGSYAFGGALGQHQPSTLLQQQQQGLPSQQQQQQSQSNGAQTSMASLLAPSPGLGAASGGQGAGDVGLDPNDFPALGSTTANPNATSSNNGSGAGGTTSYATQAGTGVLLGVSGGSGSAVGSSTAATQTRDFTPDDFPALGGQVQSSQHSRETLQNQLSSQENLSHPPGLNGFSSGDQQLRQQNLLGGHNNSLPQGTPGILNAGATQSRNVHPGFQAQTESEKQQQQRVGLVSSTIGYNFTTATTRLSF
jgi:CCR4-NOT transcription complex subunit 2